VRDEHDLNEIAKRRRVQAERDATRSRRAEDERRRRATDDAEAAARRRREVVDLIEKFRLWAIDNDVRPTRRFGIRRQPGWLVAKHLVFTTSTGMGRSGGGSFMNRVIVLADGTIRGNLAEIHPTQVEDEIVTFLAANPELKWG
jgi:hypothetical protein